MKGSTGKDRILWAMRFFGAMVGVYWLHRFLTFNLLGGAELTAADAGKAFLVGAFSDIWVAALAAVVFLLCLLLIPIRPFFQFLAGFGIFAAVTALHQSYVEYFGHPVVPFHFSYFYDLDFIKANAATSLEPNALVIVAGAVGFGLISWRFLRFKSLSALKSSLLFVAAIVLATLAHTTNIHLRVQWFVPDQLQMNAWEYLHYQIQHRRLAHDLTPDEQAFLVGKTLAPSEGYRDIVTRPVPTRNNLNELGQTLADTFHALKTEGKKPAVIVALMESQRPAETGFY